ncbi:putative protein TPRXL [Tyto alba]|uniref:putative protein TPRXL n=1 Tax=Tyto alba TaxID=56313 RepID=UPI001C669039|nr:putative protein TPRXL [Tyto alba]
MGSAALGKKRTARVRKAEELPPLVSLGTERQQQKASAAIIIYSQLIINYPRITNPLREVNEALTLLPEKLLALLLRPTNAQQSSVKTQKLKRRADSCGSNQGVLSHRYSLTNPSPSKGMTALLPIRYCPSSTSSSSTSSTSSSTCSSTSSTSSSTSSTSSSSTSAPESPFGHDEEPGAAKRPQTEPAEEGEREKGKKRWEIHGAVGATSKSSTPNSCPVSKSKGES